MITISVPFDETLEVSMAGYRFFIMRDGDRVVLERWIGDGHHKLEFNPVEDAKRVPHPNEIPLDRNLTAARVPTGIKGGQVRVIVWSRVAQDGDSYRKIEDIAEGYIDDVIRLFNRNRKRWIELGCNEARLEMIPDED